MLSSREAWSAEEGEQAAPYTTDLLKCDGIVAVPLALDALVLAGGVVLWAYTDSRATMRLAIGALPYTALALGVGFVGCGPGVHLAHGRRTAALASAAVRLAGPVVASLAVYASNEATEQRDGHDHVLRGGQAAGITVATLVALGAIGGAVAIDYALLSRPVRPVVAPMHGGGTVGASIRF